MTTSGRFTTAQTAELDGAVTQLERLEALKRELDGRQLAALARAMHAIWGSDPPGSDTSAGVGAGVGGAARGAGATGTAGTADTAETAGATGTAGAHDPPGTRQLQARGITGSELAYRSLRLEVATSLRESERVAERLLSLAYVTTEHFPTTLTLLQAGTISLNHVRVITDEGALLETGRPDIDGPRRTHYEREVLESAAEETPNRLRPIARRLAARYCAATLTERHEGARQARCVRVTAAEHGMADLVAHLPAEDAYAIRDRIHALARASLQADAAAQHAARASTADALAPETPEAGTSDTDTPQADTSAFDALPADARTIAPVAGRLRTQANVSADVLRDLLLGEPDADRPGASRIRAHVQIVLPAHGAAELIGYGIIDPGTASRLAGGAEVWERVRVDTAGAVLAVDRYRPSAAMTRLLAARDLHCRAPGCRVPVTRCDTDHTIDAALGGDTSTSNLAHLCRGHHVLKHHTDWQVTQHPDGMIRWTSPTGRVYPDRPPSRVRFSRPTPPDAQTTPDTDAETNTNTNTNTGSNTNTNTNTGSNTNTNTGSNTNTSSNTSSDADARIGADTRIGAGTGTRIGAKGDTGTETETETEIAAREKSGRDTTQQLTFA